MMHKDFELSYASVFFDDDGHQGNGLALIHITQQRFSQWSEQECLQLTRQLLLPDKNIATACFISATAHSTFSVACYNASHKIECCGHGLYAAAASVLDKCKHESKRLSSAYNDVPPTSPIQINNVVMASLQSDDELALSLPRVPVFPHEAEPWLAQLIALHDQPVAIQRVSISADDDGYLLLELDATIEIKDVSVDSYAITANTRRACLLYQIISNPRPQSSSSVSVPGALVMMRYFAPQYGVDEDMATGSVLRVLASAVDDDYGIKHFDVIQQSSRGARMRVCNEGESITVMGQIKFHKA